MDRPDGIRSAHINATDDEMTCIPEDGARARGASRLAGWAVVVLGVLAGCQVDSPTSARVLVTSASLAKGGGGGGGGGSAGGVAPTVGSVAPTAAAQDTTLDVNIFGAGFTTGARAVWSLGGDTAQVHVKSTRVVSSGQLVARLEVPAAAAVGSYDVVVTLVGGKKGVGAELFEVLFGDPQATFYFPLDDGALSLRSDRLYGDGAHSAYAHGVCGVDAKIFATTAASNSGDAIMQTNNSTFKDRKCTSYPRKMTFVYGSGDTETIPMFMNVRMVENTTYQLALDTPTRRGFAVRTLRCDQLLWASTRQGVVIDADSVVVTRVAADTWRVQTQPYPNDRASCLTDGRSYHMPVDFTIKSSRPLP